MAGRISQLAGEVLVNGLTPKGRVSQLAGEVLVAGLSPAGRVSQLAVEVLLTYENVRGLNGIASEEAFGSGGSLTLAGGAITGTAGIASAESFGSGGSVGGPITGSAGIPSEEAFGSVGAVVAGLVSGTAGIASAETFGSDAVLSGPVSGVSGISEGALGADGVVAGPVSGVAGIDQSVVGSAGIVAGPVTGAAGILSTEAFGAGGELLQPVEGLTGIPSDEAFGAGGEILSALTGYLGIPSAAVFGRGGTVVGARAFTLFIGGVDRTDYLRVDSLSVDNQMGGRANAQFSLFDPAGTFRPNCGDEVVYFEGSTRRFAGFVEQIEESWFIGGDGLIQECRCVDYAEILERRVVAKTWDGPTHVLSSIIAEILRDCLNDEGITFTADEDATLTDSGKLIINDETVAAAFRKIATAFGFDYRVDFHRALHFERNFAKPADMNLRDNDGRWISMRVKRTKRDYRNRQGVRTSIPTSGLRRVTFAGNGGWEYTLSYAVTAKPTIRVNGSEAIVVQGPGYQDGPWDFYYEIGSRVIHQNLAQPAYTGSDSIEITHPSASLDVLWIEDADEIARRRAREGGSGIYEVVRESRNVIDRAAAEDLAAAELARYGVLPVEITVESDWPGWEIGQLVTIATSQPLVSGTYLIKQCSFREIGRSFLRYTFTASGVEPPLIVGIERDGIDDLLITIDRPVDLNPGDDLVIYGLNPPWNTIDGTWPVVSIDPGGTVVKITPTDPLIPVDPWTGGIGGSGPGGPGGGGGYGGGGISDPFGGGIYTGITPTPAGPGPGVTAGTPAVIPIAVTVDGARIPEFTTDRPHGFLDTDSVAILGVTGGPGYNKERTRVDVTAPDKFRALDSFVPTFQTEPFQNDRKGRVYKTDSIPRPILNPGPLNNRWLIFGDNMHSPVNRDTEKATFVLANAIPGFASRPLMTGTNITNEWIAQKSETVVESVTAFFKNPPEGDDIEIDVKRNGVSIFAPGVKLRFAAEQATVTRETRFSEEPLVIRQDDRLTLDVTKVGSDFPGCNGSVTVTMRG